MRKWNVGILGAGRIAQGFDRPGDRHILTLAHAVVTSREFVLGGFFDIRPGQAQAAEKKWRCPPSPRSREQWLRAGWDLIYIATPDAQHIVDLRDALAVHPKGILVEKPLSLDRSSGTELLKQALRQRVPVLVNYPRRSHSGIQAVGKAIRQGKLGALRTGRLLYSGGAAHNAVHLLDLLHQWWDIDWQVRCLSQVTQATWIQLGHGAAKAHLTFINSPSPRYYIFQMDLECEKGTVTLRGSPEELRYAAIRPDPLFPTFPVCRTVAAFDMEKEPMLKGSLETMARLMRSAVATNAHMKQEIRRQAFIGRVLQFFTAAS